MIRPTLLDSTYSSRGLSRSPAPRPSSARPRPARRAPEPLLGQAEAVVRRGVEVAPALVPGRVDGRDGLGVAHLAEQVAQRRTAEPDALVVREDLHQRAAGSRRFCMPPSTASAVPVVDPDNGLAR